jgi:hypothetical protein
MGEPPVVRGRGVSRWDDASVDAVLDAGLLVVGACLVLLGLAGVVVIGSVAAWVWLG